MTTPLTRPAPAPTSSAVTTMTIQWKSSAICWVASVVAQTEDSATSAPTDRSMPPPMITNVMPTLTTPMTEASRRIVSTLSTRANRSPAVTTPTMHSSTSAMTRPRLRPSGPAMQPEPRRRSPSGDAASRLRRRRRALAHATSPSDLVVRASSAPAWAAVPSMTRSSTRCSSSASAGASVTTTPSAITSTRSARPEHLVDLAGDHDDGDPAVGQRADQRVDLRRGRRRRRRGWARRAAAPGSRAAASGPARPSAGCRRTACAPTRSTSAGRTSSASHLLARPRPLGAAGRGSRRGRTGPGWRC